MTQLAYFLFQHHRDQELLCLLLLAIFHRSLNSMVAAAPPGQRLAERKGIGPWPVESMRFSDVLQQEWLHGFSGSYRTSPPSAPPPPLFAALSAALNLPAGCRASAAQRQAPRHERRRPPGPPVQQRRRCHNLSTCGPPPDIRPAVTACRVLSHAGRHAAGPV